MSDQRAFERMRRAVGMSISIGLMAALSSDAQSGYTFVQVGASFSPVADINDAGVAVGFWSGPDGSLGYTWTRTAGAQAMITDPTTVNRFPSRTAGAVNAGLRINSEGTIAGAGCLNGCGISGYQAARLTPQGLLEFLGTFSGDSSARSVNDDEQIVGGAVGGGYNNSGPFIWNPASGIQPLAGFNGINGAAVDINNNGVIAGTKGTGTTNLAFVWSSQSGTTDIPPLPNALHSAAFALNDGGVVVGSTALPGETHAVFRWTAATGTSNLNAPPGLPEAMDINNAGDIVVTLNTGPGGRVPYLLRNGTWVNINDLLPAGVGFRIQFVTAINNRGWIVGAGTDAPPIELLQGFVLMPPNAPPVALDGSIETEVDATVSGIADASDADGDPLTFSVVQNGTKGVATFTNPSSGAFEYVPGPGLSGSDAFTFKANDGLDDSNVATIAVTIAGPAECALDVTGQVSISIGAARFDKRAGRYTQKVTLRGGSIPIQGPVSFVLDDLPPGVSVVDPAGTTACAGSLGSPYVNVDLGSDNELVNRERAIVELLFAAPPGTTITYTARLLSGNGSR